MNKLAILGGPARRGVVAGIALIGVIGLDHAQPGPALAQSGYCPVAGRYFVVGRVPGAAGSYKGEALISANATGCSAHWFPPNESSGSGDYANGVLTIYFTFTNGGSGVVKYNRAANGELHGVWWMNGNEGNQGTETLRPM